MNPKQHMAPAIRRREGQKAKRFYVWNRKRAVWRPSFLGLGICRIRPYLLKQDSTKYRIWENQRLWDGTKLTEVRNWEGQNELQRVKKDGEAHGHKYLSGEKAGYYSFRPKWGKRHSVLWHAEGGILLWACMSMENRLCQTEPGSATRVRIAFCPIWSRKNAQALATQRQKDNPW